MSKFNVGDRITIRKDLWYGHYYGGIEFTVYMHEFLGKTLTIRSLIGKDYYTEGNSFVWSDEMIEGLADPGIFTKSDLKNGMVVEFANGDKAIVLNDSVMMTTQSMAFALDCFNNQFECEIEYQDMKGFNIVKVYKSTGKTFDEFFNDENLEILWERKDEE